MAQQENAGKQDQSTEAKHGDEKPKLHSNTPENSIGQLNPSAPANTGVTPGTAGDVG